MARISNQSQSAQSVDRLPVVKERTGLSRSSIYRLESLGRFPRRIRISDRAVGWVSSEISDFISKQIQASRKE